MVLGNFIIEDMIPNIRVHLIIDDIIIAASGYSIFISKDCGKTWIFKNSLPINFFKKISSNVHLFSRLFRTGINQIYFISKNKILISCDKAFYLSDLSFSEFEKVFLPSPFFQLLDRNICVTNDYTYYGEYFPNIQRREVNIYRTKDGSDWEIVYSFPKKTIRHLHLLQYDQFSKKMWFATGDLGTECSMGFFEDDFEGIVTVGKADQKWRALEFAFEPGNVYWGSEDPRGENWLFSLDRKDESINTIFKPDCPVYNLKKIGQSYILVTANERGECDGNAHIWWSEKLNNNQWVKILSYQKDPLPTLFGFGRIFIGGFADSTLFVSGSGLSYFDNKTALLKFHEGPEGFN
jgi:hypothetical protein